MDLIEADELFRSINELSEKLQIKVFLVGGAVRDILLNKGLSKDLDFSVLGDGIDFALKFQKKQACEINTYPQFRTANIKYCSKQSICFDVDFVSARKESYPRPGCLPEIVYSTIEDDLLRRDFTVNALAVPVTKLIQFNAQPNPIAFESLVLDCCDGLGDLKKPVIKIIHNKSFFDDPTRIFRAARYLVRLDAVLDIATEKLLFQAIDSNVLGSVSHSRIFKELKLAFLEQNTSLIDRYLQDWQVYSQLSIAPIDDFKISAQSFLEQAGLKTFDQNIYFSAWQLKMLFDLKDPGQRQDLAIKMGKGKKFIARVQRVEQGYEELSSLPLDFLVALGFSKTANQSSRLIDEFKHRAEDGRSI